MSLTEQQLTTKIAQAKLIAQLSGNPVHVADDIFIWGDKIFDRATAIVTLLKVHNKLPVNNASRINLYKQYSKRFDVDGDDSDHTDISTTANIWFSRMCRTVKSAKEKRSPEDIKQQLVTLHTTYA